MLEQVTGRGGSAKAGHAHHLAVQAHEAVPVVRNRRFHGHPGTHVAGQHAVLVGLVLDQEFFHAGHGHHADVFPAERLGSFHCQLHLGTGGNDDGVRGAFTGLQQGVAPLLHVGQLVVAALHAG